MSFSFWGTSIKAGQSHEFSPPEHTLFHMSGAALDAPHDAAPASLIVKTEGKSVTLANFDPQKLTNQQVDLVFPAGVLIEFAVRSNRAGSSSKKSKSACSISVSGYLQPSPFDYMEEPSPTKKRKRSQRGIDGISSEPIESPKKAKLAVGDDGDDSDDEDYDIEDLESDEVDEDDEFSASEMLDSDDEEDDGGSGPNLDEVLNLGDISSSSDDNVAAPSPKPDNPEESVEKAAEAGVEFPMSKSQKKKLKKQKKKQKKATASAEAKKSAFDSKAPEPAAAPAAATASSEKAKKSDGEKKKAAAVAAASSEKAKKKDGEKKKAAAVDAASSEKAKKKGGGEKKKSAAAVEQKKKLQVKEQNGVKYVDFQVGTGKPVKQGKRVKVLYVGSLAKNGKQFDKSLKFPFVFKLGKGEVIKGWDLGIQGMRVGGRRKLLIPSALGYGAAGAKPDIPSHADLRFTVEVVE